MKVVFDPVEERDGIVVLQARRPLVPAEGARTMRYRTRTGALLRIDGIASGAFDPEHAEIPLAANAAGDLRLEVERRSLPAHGLPAGDGPRWRRLVRRAAQRPSRTAQVVPARPQPALPHDARSSAALTGHAHLDVAWLWTYAEARRKALRTFATAVRQIENDPGYVFAQSQPQLYAFVEETDPALFERVRALARAGRFDCSGAAMWVEPDCNLPSGESLLRQLVFGERYVRERFGVAPSVAWLPDTFGFANTLPALLAHAGIGAFATTKLSWNDSTRFPYAQFWWEGPDGSRVLAAQIASLEGGDAPDRVATARRRNEPLLLGHGDGGGGVTDAMVARAPQYGTWTALGSWFETVAARGASLPVVRDELYLQYHRGVFTTHHDIKARNAALERALAAAEQTGAWALALHASPFFIAEFRRQLDAAYEIVLRAQFHDVLPGTSIGPVYADVRKEYDRAESLIAQAASNARSVLPHARARTESGTVAPTWQGDAYVFSNAQLFARVCADGTIVDLRYAGGPNVVRRANRLVLEIDRPKRWDAWNLERRRARVRAGVRAGSSSIVDAALEVQFDIGRASLAVARIELRADEPFLRVYLAVDWQERHRLLRCRNELRFAARRARFGTPHGSIDRSLRPTSAAERAKFETCGQRYARIDGAGKGLAMLTLDTYGWSARAAGNGVRLDHSLLRAPQWPDPGADRGEHALAYAYLPFGDLGMGTLERLWEEYAMAAEVAMFTCEHESLAVVATKIADDGGGVVVRVRECAGLEIEGLIACAARAREVACIDALERPVAGEAALRDGAIAARFGPYELRSFFVRLG